MEPAIDWKTVLFIVLLALAYWKYTNDIGALKEEIAKDIGAVKKEVAEMKEILKYKLSNHIRGLLSEDIKALKTELLNILKQLNEEMAQYKAMIIGIVMKLNEQGQNQNEHQSGGIKHSICNYLEGFPIFQNACITVFTNLKM